MPRKSSRNPDTVYGPTGWRCRRCGGENWCWCYVGECAADPICDCGWLGWQCKCHDLEYEEVGGES